MMFRKEKFLRRFRERHALRFHMGVILFATALSGALASKLLLVCNVNNPAVRYPCAVIFSYLIFFACIKLWLLYVSPAAARAKGGGSGDWLISPDLSVSRAQGTLSAPRGGEFSGGGASADFSVDSPAVAEMEGMAISGSVSESGSGSAAGHVAGGIADVFDDEAGILVLVVLAAFVAVISGAAIYVVVQAPAILSEAAFEGLLAASLVKKTRLMDDTNWVGSVFKATWGPFAVTLFIAAFGGLLLHDYFPEAIASGIS